MSVVTLPGVSRIDLESDTDVRAVVADAMNAPLKNVTVIGQQIDGELYIASSAADADKVIGLLMRCVQFLTEREQIT